MKSYRVLFKRQLDGKAPSVIFLSDYDEVATIEATTRPQALYYLSLYKDYGQLANKYDPDFNISFHSYVTPRSFSAGDVLVEDLEEDHIAWIYTPFFQWAQTKLVL